MRLAVPAPRSLAASFPLLFALGAAYWFVAASLARQWADDPNYAHGFFVVPLAAVLAWRRRERFLAAPRRVAPIGMLVVAAGAAVYIAGVLAAELFTMRISIVIVLAGLVLTLEGRERFATMATPIAFLVCMVPLPYVLYYRLTFPLQLESSRLAAGLLTAVGMPVLREGNILRLEGYSLEVVSACSGLRSIMTLGTLAWFALDFFRMRRVLTLVYAAAVIPVAVGANVARLATTAGIAAIGGIEAAESFLHELSGVVVFVTGLFALIVIGKGLEWIGRARN